MSTSNSSAAPVLIFPSTDISIKSVVMGRFMGHLESWGKGGGEKTPPYGMVGDEWLKGVGGRQFGKERGVGDAAPYKFAVSNILGCEAGGARATPHPPAAGTPL